MMNEEMCGGFNGDQTMQKVGSDREHVMKGSRNVQQPPDSVPRFIGSNLFARFFRQGLSWFCLVPLCGARVGRYRRNYLKVTPNKFGALAYFRFQFTGRFKFKI